MPKHCTICFHDNREQIEKDILEAQLSYAAIGMKYGFSTSPVQSHKKHMGAMTAQTTKVSTLSAADSLCDQIVALEDRTLHILDIAEKAKHLSVAVSAIREVRAIIELKAKLTGDMVTKTVSVHHTPEWVRIRGALMTALQDYPTARAAVVAAIKETETGDMEVTERVSIST